MKLYNMTKDEFESNINNAIGVLIDHLEHDGVINGHQAKVIGESYIINIMVKRNVRDRIRDLLFSKKEKEDVSVFAVSKLGGAHLHNNEFK